MLCSPSYLVIVCVILCIREPDLARTPELGTSVGVRGLSEDDISS